MTMPKGWNPSKKKEDRSWNIKTAYTPANMKVKRPSRFTAKEKRDMIIKGIRGSILLAVGLYLLFVVLPKILNGG